LSVDNQRWVATRTRHYLFPVRVLSTLFRGKFLDALKRAYRAGKLQLGARTAELADPRAFQRFVDALYHQDWVVYAKEPFHGARQVFAYLGRYTHRVAISNQRLLAFDHNAVRFLTKDGQTATLAPREFIRRFLLHVLPDGFVKIRHFGLFAPSNTSTKLSASRQMLSADSPNHHPTDDPHTKDTAGTGTDWRAQFADLTGLDLSLCPRCGRATMIRYPLPDPSPHTAARLLPLPDG
jgi:hypothetical protein